MVSCMCSMKSSWLLNVSLHSPHMNSCPRILVLSFKHSIFCFVMWLILMCFCNSLRSLAWLSQKLHKVLVLLSWLLILWFTGVGLVLKVLPHMSHLYRVILIGSRSRIEFSVIFFFNLLIFLSNTDKFCCGTFHNLRFLLHYFLKSLSLWV